MTAVTPSQAAHDAFSGAQAYQCMMGNPPWETITEVYRLIWRFAAWAAFEAARSPESYARPELRLGKCPLHPAQREVQVRSRGEWLCLRQFLDLHEEPQPQPAPELAAAMAETRKLRELVADILTTFTVTGSGHSARVGQVQIAKWRKRAGLEA
jgi:hypothetical protein